MRCFCYFSRYQRFHARDEKLQTVAVRGCFLAVAEYYQWRMYKGFVSLDPVCHTMLDLYAYRDGFAHFVDELFTLWF